MAARAHGVTSGSASTVGQIHQRLRTAPAGVLASLKMDSKHALAVVASPDLLTVIHVQPKVDDLLRVGVLVQSLSGKKRAAVTTDGKIVQGHSLGAVILVDDCDKGFSILCELLTTVLGFEGRDDMHDTVKRWKNIFVVRSRVTTTNLVTKPNGHVWDVFAKLFQKLKMIGLIWHEHGSPECLLELFGSSGQDSKRRKVLKGIVMTSAVCFHEHGGCFKFGLANAQFRSDLIALADNRRIPLLLPDYHALELPFRSTHLLEDFVRTWPYLVPQSWMDIMKIQIDQLVTAVIRIVAALHQKTGKCCVDLVKRTFSVQHGRIWAKTAANSHSYSTETCQMQTAKQSLYSIHSISEVPFDYWVDSLVSILLDAGRDTSSLKAAGVILEASSQNQPTVKLTTKGSNVYLVLAENVSKVRERHENQWKSYIRAIQNSNQPPKLVRGPCEAWLDVTKGLVPLMDGILGHPDTATWTELEREYMRRAKQNLIDGPMTKIARKSLEM